MTGIRLTRYRHISEVGYVTVPFPKEEATDDQKREEFDTAIATEVRKQKEFVLPNQRQMLDDLYRQLNYLWDEFYATDPGNLDHKGRLLADCIGRIEIINKVVEKGLDPSFLIGQLLQLLFSQDEQAYLERCFRRVSASPGNT